MKKCCGLIASSGVLELSLVSVIVKISFDTIKSIDSNHLERRLLQFHVDSQRLVMLDLELPFELEDLIGTVFRSAESSVFSSRTKVLLRSMDRFTMTLVYPLLVKSRLTTVTGAELSVS